MDLVKSFQTSSYYYLVSTCKHRLRYSRERASQSLPKISHRLEHKLEQTQALGEFLADGARPDVIVIGSGIGGLTCAALLGRARSRSFDPEGGPGVRSSNRLPEKMLEGPLSAVSSIIWQRFG